MGANETQTPDREAARDAALERLADEYGQDADPAELARRVVRMSQQPGHRRSLLGRPTAEETVDGLWALRAARDELDQVEALLLDCVPASPNLTWNHAGVPLGITGVGAGGRWRRLRAQLNQDDTTGKDPADDGAIDAARSADPVTTPAAGTAPYTA